MVQHGTRHFDDIWLVPGPREEMTARGHEGRGPLKAERPLPLG